MSQDEGSIEVVKRFAAEQHMNYPIVMMTPELEKAFPGIAALPTSFLLDREGRIVQRHVGMLNAMVTEQETRALAGLPVNASIEEVDRAQPAKLENAQATQIPGVDLTKLSPERRTAALQKLNTEACTCGCDNTVAKCRIDDPEVRHQPAARPAHRRGNRRPITERCRPRATFGPRRAPRPQSR